MPDIAQFLETLSSAEPVPGGGSVAALDAALAAALLVMVANLTIGRKQYAGVENEVREIGIAAAALRDQAHALIEIDSDAYQAVARAMALPRSTDDEKSRRAAVMQEALKLAIIPPRDTMRTAEHVVRLARQLVPIGNRSAVSDVGVAALSARSAYQSALLNVEINLRALRDHDWISGVRAGLGDAIEIDALASDVVERVRLIIGGNSA